MACSDMCSILSFKLIAVAKGVQFRTKENYRYVFSVLKIPHLIMAMLRLLAYKIIPNATEKM